MVIKTALICFSALMVQSISGQSIGCGCSSGGYSSGISNSYDRSGLSSLSSYSGLSSGSSLSSSSAALSSGGDFIVTSVSPIAPTGISVASDIGLSGDLDVYGEVPFLSAVAFQADLPTSGSGNVDYSCGCGSNIGINSVSGGGSLNSLRGCGCSY